MGQADVEPTVETCTYCKKVDDHLEGCPTTLPLDPTAMNEYCRGTIHGFDNIESESSHLSYQLGYEQGKAARLLFECDPFLDML